MDCEAIAEAFRQDGVKRDKIFIAPDRLEVVAEVHRDADGIWSDALAAIVLSQPHRHLDRTEKYVAQDGSAVVFIDGVQHNLHKGQEIVIRPGQVHWVRARNPDVPTVIRVLCEPAWSPDDHLSIPIENVGATLSEAVA